MPKYTYEGNRDPNNSATSIRYKDQGEVYEDGQPPEVRIGGTLNLSASERDRLAPYFILTDSDGDDVGEGLIAPTEAPIDAPGDDQPTSGTGSTISRENSPSASSEKARGSR